MYKVYLSLGTNLGNRKRNIREAIDKIGEQIGVVERQSALYETKPWGYSSPNDFINSCVMVLTAMAPRQVLEATQRIEQEMGRTLKSVNGEYHDRIIDMDYLETADISKDNPKLVLYQLGFLTIKDVIGEAYRLGFPNREVNGFPPLR
jgi:2-amino-4-hydroxy-6-hydroxymethyldihydropteridine diphosphokinase